MKSKANRTEPEKTAGPENKFFWVYVLFLLGFLIAFAPALKNQFTNWDDNVYVTNNLLIKKLDLESIGSLFSLSNPVSSNYHPVTMLSLAINYSISGLQPKPYILTNIFIHLVSTFLLFFWVKKLTDGKFWIAAITAFLFACHPMHVESVVWVSERKDVLYVFFFFAGLLSYSQYLESEKRIYLLFTFLLFILSCLSKAMAVVFPIALLLLDFYVKRRISTRVLLEKVPFLLVSCLIGYIAWKLQAPDAISDFDTFTVGQRLMFGSYGFVLYIVKFFYPFHLSAYYPYPEISAQGHLPWYFYSMPLLMVIILSAPFFVYRKNKEVGKILLFGLAFFLLTIALVLQFISVGRTIMADRYSYLSYVGLSLAAAWFIDKNIIKPKNVPAMVFLTIAGVGFIYLTNNRIRVWENSGTLWTDVISKYPQVPVAYKNRSEYFLEINKQEEAFNDLITLSKLPEKDAGGFNNLGNMYSMRQQPADAIYAYTEAIKIEPENVEAYLNRAIAYSILKQYDQAFSDFRKAESIDPGSEKLHANLAFAYYNAGRYEEALNSFTKSLANDSRNADLYFFRGLCFFNLKRYKEAITDFSRTTALKPAFGDAHFNLSASYNEIGQYNEAYQAAVAALQNGFQVNQEYLNNLATKITPVR